jgi:hypothetical protein
MIFARFIMLSMTYKLTYQTFNFKNSLCKNPCYTKPYALTWALVGLISPPFGGEIRPTQVIMVHKSLAANAHIYLNDRWSGDDIYQNYCGDNALLVGTLYNSILLYILMKCYFKTGIKCLYDTLIF